MMPEGWKVAPLSDSGVSVIDGDRGTEYPKEHQFRESGLCLFLSAKNVTRAGFKFDECQFIDEDRHNKLRKGLLKRNDLVLTTRGTIGNVAFYDSGVPFNVVRVNSGMVILRNSGNQVTTRYLHTLLFSHILRRQIERLAFGSAQPQLTVKIIKDLKLFLPPTGEQKKIARILSTWDKAVETVEKLVENSKAQKKALMQQLLTGKPRQSGSSNERRRLHISDVAKVDVRSLSIKTPTDYSFRYISLSDVNNGQISDNLNSYVFSSAPSRARRVVEEGDILMATVRPNLQAFARVGTKHGGCIASTGFAVISPKKNFDGDYLYHYLFSSHVTGQLSALVVGSGYPALNSSDVKGLTIYCPAYEEQRAIANILNKADSVVENLLRQSSRLKEQKKALMQQLLTGKRRVKVDES